MKHTLAYRCVMVCTLVSSSLLVGCGPQSQPAMVDYGRAYLDARATLRQAAEDPDPRVRTMALEALAATEGQAAGPIMLQSLRDKYAPVRFAAAMAVGDTLYGPAKPALLAMIKDPAVKPKLKCALVYALHRLGEDTYTTDLGRMLRDPNDKWVRATAAMVMGRMGEQSAKGPLKSLQHSDHDPVVQLQVVEALARLGDERCGVLLEGFTKSQKYEDSIIAVQALGKLANPRSAFVLRQLLNDRNQESAVRVASAGSLARLGERVSSALPLRAATEPERVLRKARGKKAHIRPIEITSLQTIAILALGYVHEPMAVDTLAPLLKSSNGAVRVAAAKTVLVLLEAHKPPPEAEATHRPETKETKEPLVGKPTTRPRLHTSGGKD